jgi:hypothetical protein
MSARLCRFYSPLPPFAGSTCYRYLSPVGILVLLDRGMTKWRFSTLIVSEFSVSTSASRPQTTPSRYMQTSLLRLETQQRQSTVPFAGQAKQCIHHGGRNDRNRWFAAS